MIDACIRMAPPDEMIKTLAEMICHKKTDLSGLNLEDKLTEQQILELLSSSTNSVPVLHHMIRSYPETAKQLFQQINDNDQFTQLIHLKDERYDRNSLSWALNYLRSDMVKYIYTRVNTHSLYKLLSDRDKSGRRALHIALRWDYPIDQLLDQSFSYTQSHELLSTTNHQGDIAYTSWHGHRGASSEVIDVCIRMALPDEMIQVLAVMISHENTDVSGANLEDKLTKEQILQLLSTSHDSVPVLHRLITSYPKTARQLLQQITDDDQFAEFIHLKDERYDRNSLSWALVYSRSDMVKYIYTRLKTHNLYKLFSDQDKRGNTALHIALRCGYPPTQLFDQSFSDTQSHELLSITNYRGHTVYASWSEHSGANKKMIDACIRMAPPDEMIKTLAEMICHKKTDLSGANLEDKLTEQQILQLLSTNHGPFPVLHQLVKNQQISGLRKLWRKVEDKVQSTEILLSIQDACHRNILHHIVLTGHATFLADLRDLLPPKTWLCLASLKDCDGKTAFHHAVASKSSDFIKELLKSTFNSQTRDKFIGVLIENWETVQENIGKTHEDNVPIYNWALESACQRRYLMIDYPSVLVISNSEGRVGAEEEAQLLVKSLIALGFPVKHLRDLSKANTSSAIEEAVNSPHGSNGLIVAMMSHGYKGHILDNDGEPIRIADIEHSMTSNPSNQNSPKLLILQCCQGDEPYTYSATGMDAKLPKSKTPQFVIGDSYRPTSPDFCVLMSAGPGLFSQRGLMVKYLAEGLHEMRIDDDMSSVIEIVTEKMRGIKMTKEEEMIGKIAKVPMKLMDETKNQWRLCPKQVLPQVLIEKALERFQTEETRLFLTGSQMQAHRNASLERQFPISELCDSEPDDYFYSSESDGDEMVTE